MKPRRRFKLCKVIVLGFIVDDEQVDVLYTLHDKIELEADDETIWVVRPSGAYESTTVASAIDFWVSDGTLEELH